MRILVAEDDPRLLKSLMHIFELNKFSVDGISTGSEALEYAMTGAYDALVLDIMMPGLDGLEVLKRLRSSGVNTPVLFLSARSEVEQRVEGLNAGADDYLPKPFATEELIARVRAMLRRRDVFTPDVVEVRGVVLNRSTYELMYEGKQQLSGKEFQLMDMLMGNAKCVISTEQLITRIWGWDAGVDTSVVWVHISNLRKKLSAVNAPVHIRFLRGAGYILE